MAGQCLLFYENLPIKAEKENQTILNGVLIFE